MKHTDLVVRCESTWGTDKHEIISDDNTKLSSDILGTDVLVIGKKNLTKRKKEIILNEVKSFLDDWSNK